MNIEMLPVDELHLDLNNPRIARMLEMYEPSEITAEQISLALGAGESQPGETYTTFLSLKEAIRTNGGIIQAIIVNRRADRSLVVIEGNTRTQIYRDFVKEGVDGDWTTIPAVVHDDLPQKEIDAIRLQTHLVGPRPWDPYSKAKYLDYLRNSRHLTFDQIVEFCGGRRRQILDYVAAFHDMEDHYRPRIEESGGSFDATRFSPLVEMQRPDVQGVLAAAGFTKSNFAQRPVDALTGRQVNVRKRLHLLANPNGRDIFLEEGAQEARRGLAAIPAAPNVSDATLAQSTEQLKCRSARLEWRNLQRMKSNPPQQARGSIAA